MNLDKKSSFNMVLLSIVIFNSISIDLTICVTLFTLYLELLVLIKITSSLPILDVLSKCIFDQILLIINSVDQIQVFFCRLSRFRLFRIFPEIFGILVCWAIAHSATTTCSFSYLKIKGVFSLLPGLPTNNRKSNK